MKSLFGGTLSRTPYVFIAVPIVLLHLAMPLISRWAPLFFAKVFHADLANVSIYVLGLLAFMGLLQLVLFVAVLKRLRDVGWNGWLAAPLILVLLLPFAAGVIAGQAVLSGKSANETAQLVLTWLGLGITWYVRGLALVLLFVPSRKPTAPADTASAF